METNEKFDIGILNEEIKYEDGIRDWGSGSTYPCTEDTVWLAALLKAQAVREAIHVTCSSGDVTLRQARMIVAAAAVHLEKSISDAVEKFFDAARGGAERAAAYNVAFKVTDEVTDEECEGA